MEAADSSRTTQAKQQAVPRQDEQAGQASMISRIIFHVTLGHILGRFWSHHWFAHIAKHTVVRLYGEYP